MNWSVEPLETYVTLEDRIKPKLLNPSLFIFIRTEFLFYFLCSSFSLDFMQDLEIHSFSFFFFLFFTFERIAMPDTFLPLHRLSALSLALFDYFFIE